MMTAHVCMHVCVCVLEGEKERGGGRKSALHIGKSEVMRARVHTCVCVREKGRDRDRNRDRDRDRVHCISGRVR